VRHNPSTSTVIVGQHTLLREGLAALLQHSTYKVVASAGHASDLREVRVSPDRQSLAIVTIDDTVGSPAEAADNIRILRARLTCPRIVVVAETRNPVDIQKITSLAPNAYIANITSRELLLKVLDFLALAQPILVLSSDGAIPSEPLARLEPLEGAGSNGRGPTGAPGNGQGPQFSHRERQVLAQLARGSSNKEIARLFSIAESTVKVHLKALLRKIGVRNRTEAAIWVVARDNLVPSERSLCPIASDRPSPPAV
jgi:two-component system, NarL family, nitrate/nitrite response regulator NarL